MSDDNDKTRIQPPAPRSPAEGGEGTDTPTDKTRVAPRPQAKATKIDPELEQKRRLLAQKKARELEQRLAAMADSKRNARGAAAEDRTRIQPRSVPPSPEDRTRVQPRATQTANPPAAKPRPHQPPAADKSPPARGDANAPDKTVFKSRPPAAPRPMPLEGDPSEPTTINALAKADAVAHGRFAASASGNVEILKGRFMFEEILGAGGMGVVYKAKDLLKVEAQDRDPYVAIKVLGEEFKAHPEAFIALQRESRKTQRIAHPNIVNVHDFDRDGDTVFMTMEYLEGKPLDKWISQYKATGLPEEDVWKILEGICAALIYAHDQKIIHSDFKPGNIFVTNTGVAKVFDFGIARAVAKAEALDESVDDKTVFDAGNLGALTPAYASLEMLEGKVPDVRDDIYALGCIAYEMFTGNHPFNRVHANEAQRQKLKPKRIAVISKRQWKVIEKALAFKREDRITSVEEFWRELTHKRASRLLITGVASLLLAATGLLVYQNYFAPKAADFSEDEIRSEIQRDLLINQNKKVIDDNLATPEFTASWERSLYDAYQVLGKLLGENDLWLLGRKQSAYQMYLAQISTLITQEDFEQARVLHTNAARYTDDGAELAGLLEQLTAAEATRLARLEEEKQRQAAAAQQRQVAVKQATEQKERDTAFDVAMSTVNKQLECRSTMNMRDVDIAISKLRQLNPARYRSEENSIVVRLASCIAKIGSNFPERGEEFKKRALRIFPDNPTVANIKIAPKDPCDVGLAGLGARGNRAVCRDSLDAEGESFGKGPALVVIPAKGSLAAFAIGKYEVTVEDFNLFCQASGSCPVQSGGDDKLPMTQVALRSINAYLNWLSQKSKRQYRLPSQAEWIYAARAEGSKVDSNRNCRLDSRGIKKGGALVKASTGQQNNWGLVNHLGNAQELVEGGGSLLALGGAFDTPIEECVETQQVEHRGTADPLTGFRVLRELQ